VAPTLVDPLLLKRLLIHFTVKSASQVNQLIPGLGISILIYIVLGRLLPSLWQRNFLNLGVVESLTSLLVLKAEPRLVKLVFRQVPQFPYIICTHHKNNLNGRVLKLTQHHLNFAIVIDTDFIISEVRTGLKRLKHLMWFFDLAAKLCQNVALSIDNQRFREVFLIIELKERIVSYCERHIIDTVQC